LTIPESFGLGPGARSFWAKSIGRAGPPPEGIAQPPQDAAGWTGDRPVAPTRREPFSWGIWMVGPPGPWNGSRLMIFTQKVLAPGPGTQLRATFRWRPFQSALSGSLFFKPPALPEVVTPQKSGCH